MALCIAFFLLAACSPAPQYKQVHLSSGGEAASIAQESSQRTPLRVAVSSIISPKETFKTYHDLLTHLGGRLDRQVELVQRKTYAEVNELIRDGGIDLAFVCTLAYVKGQQEFGMELLAAPQVRGEALYRSYIIVPADSPASSIDQLRNKMFAFTDPDSNTGRLVPSYLLWQRGERPETFFRRVVYTYSHDNSIKAVADKQVDAASVDSLVYDYALARNPEIAQKTRVIWRSDPYGSPPVVVHPNLAPTLKGQLRDLIVGLADEPRGKAFLDGLMVDRFVVPELKSYQPVRKMLEDMRAQG